MTYNASHPTDKDTARYALGDTSNDAATELLTDTTIIAELTARGYAAGVAFLAGGLATRFAQLPTSLSSGPDAMAWADRVDAWQKLAVRMDAETGLASIDRMVTSRALNRAVW